MVYGMDGIGGVVGSIGGSLAANNQIRFLTPFSFV